MKTTNDGLLTNAKSEIRNYRLRLFSLPRVEGPRSMEERPFGPVPTHRQMHGWSDEDPAGRGVARANPWG